MTHVSNPAHKDNAAATNHPALPNGNGDALRPHGYLYRAGKPILDIYTACTWLARLRGLFAHPHLQPHEALLIKPCSSVHTLGLRKTIDVVFLNGEGVVLQCRTLKPWSLAVCNGARCVVEMAGSKAQQLDIRPGQQLLVEDL